MKKPIILFSVVMLCLIVGSAAFYAGSQSTSSNKPKEAAYNIPTPTIFLIQTPSPSPTSNLTGPAGPQGLPGTNGATWYNGTGAPLSNLGTSRDFYLDLVSGDVYNKNATTWIKVANIKGPMGSTGPQGLTGVTGMQGLKGDTGLTGATGAPGATGSPGSKGDTGLGVAKKGNISIATSAFTPLTNGSQYYNYGDYLTNIGSSTQWFVAPVQLPQGANLTKLGCYWFNGNSQNFTVLFFHANAIAGSVTVGSLSLPFIPDLTFSSTSLSHVVNNNVYSYNLQLALPAPDFNIQNPATPRLSGIRALFIEYEFP
jgi:hypothetical protein